MLLSFLLKEKRNCIYNYLQNGQTVLHIAASYGQLECMKEIHLKLPSESTAQTEENPYLKQDKVVHSSTCRCDPKFFSFLLHGCGVTFR